MINHIRKFILPSLFVLMVSGLCGAEGPAKKPLPFAPGETLVYQVNWSVFPAGHVVAKLARIDSEAGDDYEVETTANSSGFVSLLFKVQDEFHSIFNPNSLCSQRIWKTVNEGHRHKKTLIVFDSTKHQAILDERDLNKPNAPPKHAEHEIPGCVEDVLSVFYYLRTQPLKVGERLEVPVNDGSKTHVVTVQVQAREQIQTPLGPRMALRVEPTVFGGLYKRKGRMLVWFSDDKRHIPLRIKAMINIGSITGTLESYTPGSQDLPVGKQ